MRFHQFRTKENFIRTHSSGNCYPFNIRIKLQARTQLERCSHEWNLKKKSRLVRAIQKTFPFQLKVSPKKIALRYKYMYTFLIHPSKNVNKFTPKYILLVRFRDCTYLKIHC